MTPLSQEVWRRTWGFWKLVTLSLLMAFVITGLSLLIGSLVIADLPIQENREGLLLLKKSFLVIVVTQFALTALSMILLLRKTPGSNRIFLVLLFPWVTYHQEVAAYFDYLLLFGTWLTLWLTLFVRKERQARPRGHAS